MNKQSSRKKSVSILLHRAFWPAVTAAYALSASLLHLELSKIIIAPVKTPVGSFTPADYSRHLALFLVILTALYALFGLVKGKARIRTITYWVLWAGAACAANRFLLFSPNEYAHYPQYALMAILLVLCLDPGLLKWPVGTIIFWGTTIGIADELLQYLFICPSYGNYLDFNDFLLNQLGVAAGLLLVYGFREQKTDIGPLLPFYKTWGFRTVVVVLAAVLVFALWDRLKITPPKNIPPGGFYETNGKTRFFLERKPGIMGAWNRLPDGRAYYVLSPAQGTFLLFAAGFVFASFDPRCLRRRIR